MLLFHVRNKYKQYKIGKQSMNTIYKCLLSSLLGLSIIHAYAAKPALSSVNKSSCGKLAYTTHPFILVLNNNDNLISSITQCAKAAKLKGASISGLGQVHNPVLAYFSSDPNAKPTLTSFHGYYELASLT